MKEEQRQDLLNEWRNFYKKKLDNNERLDIIEFTYNMIERQKKILLQEGYVTTSFASSPDDKQDEISQNTRCKGITKSGDVCGMSVKKGKLYCRHHKKEESGEESGKKKSKRKKSKRKGRKKKNSWKEWTAEEDKRLLEFYNNPENHYDGGELIGEKVQELADELGRTKSSLSNRMSVKNFHDKEVYGTSVKTSKKHRFPNIRTSKVRKEVTRYVFEDLTSKRGNELHYSDAFASLNIEEENDWNMFLNETMLKSAKITLALGRANLLKVIRDEGTPYLRYG